MGESFSTCSSENFSKGALSKFVRNFWKKFENFYEMFLKLSELLHRSLCVSSDLILGGTVKSFDRNVLFFRFLQQPTLDLFNFSRKDAML